MTPYLNLFCSSVIGQCISFTSTGSSSTDFAVLLIFSVLFLEFSGSIVAAASGLLHGSISLSSFLSKMRLSDMYSDMLHLAPSSSVYSDGSSSTGSSSFEFILSSLFSFSFSSPFPSFYSSSIILSIPSSVDSSGFFSLDLFSSMSFSSFSSLFSSSLWFVCSSFPLLSSFSASFLYCGLFNLNIGFNSYLILFNYLLSLSSSLSPSL